MAIIPNGVIAVFVVHGMNERQAAESRLGEGRIARISNLEGAAAGGTVWTWTE